MRYKRGQRSRNVYNKNERSRVKDGITKVQSRTCNEETSSEETVSILKSPVWIWSSVTSRRYW